MNPCQANLPKLFEQKNNFPSGIMLSTDILTKTFICSIFSLAKTTKMSTSSWVKFLVAALLFSCAFCDVSARGLKTLSLDYLRVFQQIVPDGFEEYLENLKNDNLVDPNVNIAMYNKVRLIFCVVVKADLPISFYC